MNPISKKIYNKLSQEDKTELKSEKIELALVDELKQRGDALYKAVEKADILWKDYQDYLSGADTPFSKMINAYNDLDGAVQFAEGVSRRFEKAGDELGIDTRSNKDFQNIERNLKTSRDVLNIISSFKDPSSFQ